jgi:hypothetical protein
MQVRGKANGKVWPSTARAMVRGHYGGTNDELSHRHFRRNGPNVLILDISSQPTLYYTIINIWNNVA